MSKYQKLFQRFLSKPSDFTWQELQTLLNGLGYVESTAGKTSGSRARFLHKDYATIILHKPHPKPILKSYQLNQIFDLLKQEGLL